MSSSKDTRRSAALNSKTERAISNYATVAGAAGVSLLALVQPSAAKIIYTPVHTIINPSSTLNLDINQDGISDFTITNQNYSFAPGHIRDTGSLLSYGAVTVTGGSNSNHVVGKQPFASALPMRFRVGSNDQFIGGSAVPPTMELCERSTFSTRVDNGYWPNAQNKYLGLKFSINGQTHFGWARFSVKRSACKITALLTGYAYETVANRPIATGKTSGPVDAAELLSPSHAPMPPALGLLAQGADGLAIWRKEEETVTK